MYQHTNPTTVTTAACHSSAVVLKRTMDPGHPVLDQAVFARFVERGDYDRRLRRCRRAYRERRDVLVAAPAEHFPDARVSGIAAGLHAITELPGRYAPEENPAALLAAAGVMVRPLSSCTSGRADADEVRLVLGYAHLTPARIREDVKPMAESLTVRRPAVRPLDIARRFPSARGSLFTHGLRARCGAPVVVALHTGRIPPLEASPCPTAPSRAAAAYCAAPSPRRRP